MADDFFKKMFSKKNDDEDVGEGNNFDLSHFAKWLKNNGEEEETLQEFVEKRRKDNAKEQFKKKKKKK